MVSDNASKVRRGFRRRILHVSNLIRLGRGSREKVWNEVKWETSCNVIESCEEITWSYVASIPALLWEICSGNMAASTSTSSQVRSESLKEPKEQSFCITCGDVTKYVCIQCSTSVCNRCSRFEENEECKGWIAGKSVGYCLDCNILVSSKGDEEEKVTAFVASQLTTNSASTSSSSVLDRFV